MAKNYQAYNDLYINEQ